MTTTDHTITWAAMTAAGIDTDCVESIGNAQDTSLESYEIVSTDRTTKLVFGEYYDPEEGGYDRGVYEQTGTADDPQWTFIGAPDWYETPAALLADVATWAAQNVVK